MKKHQIFDNVILTPSTKAVSGHDIYISREEILKDNKVVAEINKKLFKSRIRGTYGIKMVPNLDDDSAMLVLGIVLMLHHEKEENR